MTYTRLQVRDLIKQRCNIENTTVQQNAELDNHINDSASYVHDFLISTWGERYARKASLVSIVSGTSEYTIGATDFYRPIRVNLLFNDINYPLRTFSAMDFIQSNQTQSWDPLWLPRYSLNIGADGTNKIEFTPIPDTSHSVTLVYHPTAPTYSSDSSQVKIPHVNLLIIEACIRVKDKDERDASRFMQERALIQKRIEDWDGSADAGNVEETLRTGRFRVYRGVMPDGRLF